MAQICSMIDTFRNTKDVLKSFRSKQEERLKDHLVSQVSFSSTVITQTLPLKISASRDFLLHLIVLFA